MALSTQPKRLKKQLTLFDVYAVSTGAMFSSGFFLLPGIAAAETGPSVVLAYLFAAVFILPAMFSVAELSTAMPRAGGAYYFLDRSLGPMVGTVGGLGTWLALVLKSAFALVGMGAYLALFVDVPIKPLAVGLTVAFMLVNIFGAKETTGLQRILVTALVVILAFFIVQGLAAVAAADPVRTTGERFSPLFPFGLPSFLGTIGLVFVSYAGLTKVASIAEEVQDPDRNIPLGMILSLLTATLIYVVGVYIIVAVLEPAALHSDLTPVATAAAEFFDWLPAGVGVGLIVVAAIAAFASTGNAGILSASRYPLAMARDRLVWRRFAEIGRFGTPVVAVVVTSVLMVAAILLLDIEGIAKLASAFQLLLFSMLNLAVIIMRESQIEAYDPGYRSPLYPWMQIFGMLAPFWLIAEMGELARLFTVGLIALGLGWYFYRVRGRVERAGAIFHAFARLGERRHQGLDLELRAIVQEKGLREEDPFDEVVARAAVLDFSMPAAFDEVVRVASVVLAKRTGRPAERLADGFLKETEAGALPVARGVALPHLRSAGVERPEMVLVRCPDGVRIRGDVPGAPEAAAPVYAVFFLLSPEADPAQHLRLLGHLARHVDDESFLEAWRGARNEQDLKETLLREERSLSLHLAPDSPAAGWVGRALQDLDLPPGVLVALVRRDTRSIVPQGSTVLKDGDRLTIIGDPAGIRTLADRYAPAREVST